jgi:holliday junction DNA helicase RuvA
MLSGFDRQRPTLVSFPPYLTRKSLLVSNDSSGRSGLSTLWFARRLHDDLQEGYTQIDRRAGRFVNLVFHLGNKVQQTQPADFQERILIAHITGKLIQKQPNSVIVDVGGVGYELTVPLSTFYDLGDPGADVSLRAYTYVREDALQLFGFRTEREKRLFLLMIGVSGIGPKLAITALSGMSAEELIHAIRTENLAKLVGVPGIGKKTAERMLVELKDKVAQLASPEMEEQLKAGAIIGVGEAMRDDLISALINLGYQKAAAEKAVSAALNENPGAHFEAALKQSLRKLAK